MAVNLANAFVGASVSNATITFATNQTITARGVGDWTSLIETARQSQWFQVIIWAPNTAMLDLVGMAINGVLSRTVYLTLPYGVTTESLIRRRDDTLQDQQNAGIFRRVFIWDIEYPTVDMVVDPAVVFVNSQTNGIKQPTV